MPPGRVVLETVWWPRAVINRARAANKSIVSYYYQLGEILNSQISNTSKYYKEITNNDVSALQTSYMHELSELSRTKKSVILLE